MAQDEGATNPWSLAPSLPHPRHWVRVEEGTPFVVPQGTTFVVTAVGSNGVGNGNAFLDGNPLVKAVASVNVPGPSSVVGVGPFVTAPSGGTLTVSSNQDDGRLWGYLFRTNDPLGSSFAVPPPSQWVAIREGSPYQVPAGKLLVVTTIIYATAGLAGLGFLEVDGQPEFIAYPTPNRDANTRTLPIGLAVPGGGVVEPFDADGAANTGRAWGFLVDA